MAKRNAGGWKRATWLEKKLFPNDSPYQRSRRRSKFFFGAVGFVLLILAVIRLMSAATVFVGRRRSRGAAANTPFPSVMQPN